MADVVINELSVVGQARDSHAADDLMRGLARALQAVMRINSDCTVHKHQDLANKYLTKDDSSDITLHNWLVGPFSRELMTIRSFLIKLLAKGPYLDLLIRDTPHVCYHTFQGESTDYPFSGLAGAAHLRVALLSLADCPRFPKGFVNVRYGSSEASAVAFDLQHFLDERDVDRARRKYEAHEKHKGGPTRGARGTLMDLSDDDAQTALDRCVAISGEKRVCARFGGRIYVFHPHRPEENYYHGFPMDESELREKIPALYRILPPAD